MKYRKIRAEKIFDGYKYLEGSVLMMTEDGVVADIVPASQAGDEVETFQGIITPGFINCHCHLELSHMKGQIPEGTGLVDFVFKIVTGRHHSEEEILAAITRAEDEMIQNGIVAVGDICNNMLTLTQKKKGRIQYYNFIESSGWLPRISEERFNRALQLYRGYKEGLPANDQESIVPHAAYSVSQQLWQQIKPWFENKVVSIHNQETAFEDEFFLQGTGDFNRMYELMKIDNIHHEPTGKSSLQSYFHQLTKAASILLVHNTFTQQSDIDYIKQQPSENTPPVSFCLCANANMYIEQTMPPIELLRKNQCRIVLGTDSLASNWSLSIIDEINTILKHDPLLPLEELLQWATINGAKALQMEDNVGSIKKGKRPGLVLVSNDIKTLSLKAQRIV